MEGLIALVIAVSALTVVALSYKALERLSRQYIYHQKKWLKKDRKLQKKKAKQQKKLLKKKKKKKSNVK